MTEEFQESDIIFSEAYGAGNFTDKENMQNDLNALSCSNKMSSNKKKKKMARSKPVNIPNSRFRITYPEEDFDAGEVVPPHVIIARRKDAAGEMAFSMCSGNGRRLKGRDLSFVRNSILRLTGFLET